VQSDEIEELLAEAPVAALPPPAERRIIETLLAAHPQPAHRWPRVVPIWQALLACAAVWFLTILWFKPQSSPHLGPETEEPLMASVTRQPELAAGVVKLDSSPWDTLRRPAYRTDIRRWTCLNVQPQGATQP